MKHLITPLAIASMLLVHSSCNQKPTFNLADFNYKDTTYEQALLIFDPVPNAIDSFANGLSPEKIALGERLYFDTRLSAKGNNSCNSCHNLATYGVDNQSFSTGDEGQKGGRNSPTVYNSTFHESQFWDGRAASLEEQAGMPILNPVEMNIPNKEFLVARLRNDAHYLKLFKNNFNSDFAEPLTYTNIQNAIAAFEHTLITPSKFDQYLKGNTSVLNAKEKKGLQLFMDKGCASCHNGVALGGTMLQKFGIYDPYQNHTKSTKVDYGKMEQTKLETDKFLFKVPSLRNSAKTHPYFHDGSVADLSTAVTIMAKTQLNTTLKIEEIEAIVAFLNTLTGELPKKFQK